MFNNTSFQQFIGSTFLVVNGILNIFSDNNADVYLVISRLFGGFTQGLTYVVVVVHASDNATKEFREFLMLSFGATLNYSILLSVMAFFYTESLMGKLNFYKTKKIYINCQKNYSIKRAQRSRSSFVWINRFDNNS